MLVKSLTRCLLLILLCIPTFAVEESPLTWCNRSVNGFGFPGGCGCRLPNFRYNPRNGKCDIRVETANTDPTPPLPEQRPMPGLENLDEIEDRIVRGEIPKEQGQRLLAQFELGKAIIKWSLCRANDTETDNIECGPKPELEDFLGPRPETEASSGTASSNEGGKCVGMLRNAFSGKCYSYNKEECHNPPDRGVGCMWIDNDQPSQQPQASAPPSEDNCHNLAEDNSEVYCNGTRFVPEDRARRFINNGRRNYLLIGDETEADSPRRQPSANQE